MRSVANRLGSGRILVADGATGTSYQEMGLGLGVAPEEWVETNPEKVIGLHCAFIEAGAEMIPTDSFGGTPLRLVETSFNGRGRELNRRAAALAREAASSVTNVLVAGSMGPTGIPCGSSQCWPTADGRGHGAL